MKANFLFLGTGASTGVPLIGCSCSVCQSTDPHNKRLRPAGLLRVGDKTLLIDVGPDFRQQALACGLTTLDGLLLTHTHYDHIAGIDELRVFNFRQQKPFPVLLSHESMADLKERYAYMFKKRLEGDSHATTLDCHLLPGAAGTLDFLGVEIRYVSFQQASMKVNGFRIGSFAYVTDIQEYDEEVLRFLEGVEWLVLSALREDPSPVHFSLAEAADFAQKVGATRTWLTHLSHAVDQKSASAKLPTNVQLGFDGLEFSFDF
jgi:phosphoribosyl 1,2-cyclic phosphate phosphodiesterase